MSRNRATVYFVSLTVAVPLELLVTSSVRARDLYTDTWIVFQSERDVPNVYELYKIRPDGSDLTRLTYNTFQDGSPRWSPDGSKIAFNSDRDGNWEIYVMDADGTNQTRITDSPASEGIGSYSPDGQRIAISSNRDGNGEIYVMDADGSNPLRLTDHPATEGTPLWSPDGSKIAFMTDRDGNGEIYVMNADGTSQTRLTNDPYLTRLGGWSPDGTQIVFFTGAGGDQDIYLMNADGSNVVTLLNSTVVDGSPSWSPDGTLMVFVSDRDVRWETEIYVMHPDGTNQTRLTFDSWADHNPRWSPWPEVSQTVEVDVKPGSDPNCFNLNGHGAIPVAVLGSDELDVIFIDPTTLLFDGLQVRVRANKGPQCSFEDSNGDGYDDLVCQFEDDPDNWIAGGDTGTLTGLLFDGTLIEGTDSICIVP